MKKLTFKLAEKLHKELWGWLAETGNGSKSAWPKWDFNQGKIESMDVDCFACAVVNNLESRCHGKCQIDWTKNYGFGDDCLQDDSPFYKWDVADTARTRKKYAAIIRDLPWRKKK
jgi:hypothetical protein